MRILSFIPIALALSISNIALSSDSLQKYIQISNQTQTESDKIVIYEFFGMAVHIVTVWNLQ